MTDKPEVTYEERITRLEAIVRQLETGDPSLEDALELFAEGIGLAQALKRQLDAAEARIEQIMGDGTLEPLLPAEDETS